MPISVLRKALPSETVETSATRVSNGGPIGIRVFPQITSANLQSSLSELSKWIALGFFGMLFFYRHDAESLWGAMGLVLSVIITAQLKLIINQTRPAASTRSDPGMPSSHSQFFFCIVTFAIHSVVEWVGINEGSLTISGFMLVCSSYLSWLRVVGQQHKMSQVVVGATVGIILCTL